LHYPPALQRDHLRETNGVSQSGTFRAACLAGRAGVQQFWRPHRPGTDPCGRRQGDRSRHHPLRHRRRLRQSRRLGDRAGRCPGAAPQGRRARHEVRHADGLGRQAVGRGARLRHLGGRSEPEAAEDRLDRPLPAASSRSEDADRGDAAGARRPRAAGQGALRRVLQPRRLAVRRCSLDCPHRGLLFVHLHPGRIQSPATGHRAGPDPRGPAFRGRASPLLSPRRRTAHRQVPARRGSCGRHALRDDPGHVGPLCDRRKLERSGEAGGVLLRAREDLAGACLRVAPRTAGDRQRHRRRDEARAGGSEREGGRELAPEDLALEAILSGGAAK
jgi:hypothetical protein